MSATPGYLATVNLTGDAVTITGEATSNIDSGAWKKYQITDATKRVLDFQTSVTVKKNGTSVSSSDYVLDYFFGIVTFATALTDTDVVTIDGGYRPLVAVIGARQVSLQINNDILESTAFDDAAVAAEKTRIYGLTEASGTLGSLRPFDVIMDTAILVGIIEGRNAVVLDIYLGNGDRFRGLVTIEQVSPKASVSDLLAADLSFKTTSTVAIGFATPFSFNT